MKAPKNTSRFPLLLYRHLARRWRMPAFWLIPGGIALWWGAAQNPALRTNTAWLPLLIAIIGAIIFGYTLLAGRACVRSRRATFTLQTPLYPLAISYRRITGIRPVEFVRLFPPEQEKAARRRLVQPLWGKTAVVVDLRAYPMPLWWLKLWLSPYLFAPHNTGLVFVVEDWMGLIRALETERSLGIQQRN